MGFFSEPTKTFSRLRDNPFDTALSHFFLVLITFFIINLVTRQLPASAFYPTLSGITSSLILAVANGILWIFLGLAVYLGLIIIGTRTDIGKTLKVIAYGVSPLAFFAFVPVFGVLWPLWGLGLVYLGLREFHGISPGKAVFVAIIVPILAIILLWFMLSTFWPGIL